MVGKRVTEADSNGGIRLTVSRQDKALVIVLRGNLELAAVEAVTNCIEGALCDYVRVCILDCREVTITDSRVLRILLGIQDRFRQCDRELRLIGLNGAYKQ